MDGACKDDSWVNLLDGLHLSVSDDDDDNVLTRLRSIKYSEVMMETPPPVTMDAEQEAPPTLNLSSNQIQPLLQPTATSSPHQENQGFDADLEPESSPMMLYLSGSLQESLVTEVAASTPNHNQTAASSEVHQTELLCEPVSGPSAGPTKPRRDKLARLKELGLDPPPVAKLCPDDGAFVQLEPPQTNPGELCFWWGLFRPLLFTSWTLTSLNKTL